MRENSKKASLKPESPENFEILLHMIDNALETFAQSGIFRIHSMDSRDYEKLITGLLRHSLYREAEILCREGKLKNLRRIYDGIILDKPDIDLIVENYKKSIK